MPWKILQRRGVWLPEIDWWLDAQTRQTRSFISHAHGDHVARHGEVICTRATAHFLRFRVPGIRKEHPLAFGQAREIAPGVTATLHPAGHILGSCMVRIEGARGSLLYTGDFRLRGGLAAEACECPAAETLIMETTFGLPQYRFPPAEEVARDLIAFCQETLAERKTPVLLCYGLGKSQEVLQALAPAGLPVMLPQPTYHLTELYRELGQQLPPTQPFEPLRQSGHVVICPPNARGTLQSVLAPRTAIVSGWAIDPGARYRFRCDAGFPLSDHSDFDELLEFVRRVKPRRILTVHGFAREFASTLRAEGWDALALGRDNQLELPLSPVGDRDT